ncbi:MAG: hypothetical protein HFI56_14805 [Lachnospiraceae bacterium]|nr:hypothetical protein [Lachnospiraceae bacterium]MCI9397731.1 hypothetical protein [Lachnospiraceae bacterium]
MRKFMSALCLLAILCVAGLVFTQLYDGENPAMEDIGAGTDELVDQVKDMYEEYGAAAVAQADEKLGDVVEQADEKLGEVVEQADEAIGEAVESAVEGAKEGFLESIKESISSFFQDLSS